MAKLQRTRSADGTSIVFETQGDGPALILVGGMMCDRAKTRDLSAALSRDFKVYNFDRRGRGQSGNNAPYGPRKEIEDIAALLNEAGPDAALYGHSSGAGLALLAAGAGLPIGALILHEPPYGPDDPDSIAQTRDFSASLLAAIERRDFAGAVSAFYGAIGMSGTQISELTSDEAFMAMVPTMAHDIAVMGEIETGGVVPDDIVKSLAMPVLMLTGETSLPFFHDTAKHIAGLLRKGTIASLPGQDHSGDPAVVADAVRDFFKGMSG
jgi:pimeloyl-ACP methyl ester carboxylesterase